MVIDLCPGAYSRLRPGNVMNATEGRARTSEEAPLNRAEQLHDQAEFLRSLAKAARASSKREQLLRAAEQCERLADTFGRAHTRRAEPRPSPEPLGVSEPYFRMPTRKH
jgi:hypothetical protein